MNDPARAFIEALVSDSIESIINEFMDEFESKLNKHEAGLDMSKLRKDDQIVILKLETTEKAIALVHKEGRYAVDLDPYNMESALIPISGEKFDKLIKRGLELEKKYNEYNVTVTSDLDEEGNATNPVSSANAEQEEAMLDTCMKILDTIDGKESHYKDLKHKSYGHVTVVEDEGNFVVALTCSGRVIFGSVSPTSLPLRFSKAVTDAMRTVYQVVNEKLENTIPAYLKALLPIVNARFNALSADERKSILDQIRENRKKRDD